MRLDQATKLLRGEIGVGTANRINSLAVVPMIEILIGDRIGIIAKAGKRAKRVDAEE